MPSSSLPQVKILFAGSSGLLGNIVIDRLRALASDNVANVDVYSLVRSPPSSSDASPSSENFRLRQFQWDGLSPPSALPEPASITHVVNFCGENISGDDESLRNKIGLRIWESPGKKNRILSSRIGPTTGLKEWIDSNCRDVDYIVASGVGVYGCDYFDGAIGKEKEGEDKPDFDDEGDKRKGFLYEVSKKWEKAATGGEPSNACRTTILRIAPVLTASGGVLGKLLLPFKFGLGGKVGSGDQFFPYISALDFSRVVVDHVILGGGENAEEKDRHRIYNLIAPEDATNLQFTEALGTALSRPTVVPLPSFAARLLFGEMAEEVLLGGTRCAPNRLLNEGFKFSHDNIASAIKSAVNDKTL